LWGFVKEAVYVRPLPTTLVYLENHITSAVNSVMQDILQVWNDFSYLLVVMRAAGGATLNIRKLYFEYNQIYFTSYLSVALCLIYRLAKSSLILLNSRNGRKQVRIDRQLLFISFDSSKL
jgi:hypothetical protein